MRTLPSAGWRERPGIDRLIAALTTSGGQARYVGGAVRDTLAGLTVSDVDLATNLLPEAVVERLVAARIKAVPTGVAHGTITAICESFHYEITTLRRDVETDGRHAKVAFSDDWRSDAARRDFTINALYADPVSAEVFDWFGGVDDLRAGRVRFIGDPVQRIAEDHLRILRFYRFAARFGRGPIDPASHAAVVAARHSLRTLSRERVADELMKLLRLAEPAAMIARMIDDQVLSEILPEADAGALGRLEKLLANETCVKVEPEAVRRLAALLPTPSAAEAAAPRLRLSNRVRTRLGVLLTQRSTGLKQPPLHLAYRIGTAEARDCWLLAGSGDAVEKAIDQLTVSALPRFPIKGGALVARGVVAGPDVARLLRQIEERWIAEDFPVGSALNALVDQILFSEARQ